MSHAFVSAIAFAAFAATFVPCQSTLTVGPGGYPDLDAAIAAASPGDVLVVMPGTYPGFAVTKGVTIRPAFSGTVTFSAAAFPAYISVQIPAGQVGHLVELQLPVLIVTGGRLGVVDCSVGPNQLTVLGGALVVLNGCTVTSTNPTVGAAYVDQQSELVAVDSTIVFTPPPLPFAPRPAVDVVDSRLRGSRLNVTAAPNPQTGQAGPAVRGDAASAVWLSDCTLVGGAAGCAIEAPNGRHDRCVLTPPCSTLPSGFVLGVHRAAPLTNGAVFTVTFALQPGMAVGVFAALSFESQALTALEQPLLLPASGAFALTAVVANAQGSASASWLVPAGPQLVDRTLWLQGFSGFTLPLQASALVGGVVR